MPLRIENYAPSKKLYALNLDTFQIYDSFSDAGYRHASATVSAIWTTHKSGIAQVSMGTISHSFAVNRTPPEIVSFESFMENCDSRYGGNPIVRWDGEYMWAPDTKLSTMNAFSKILDPILENLPEVPNGYTGWYKLTSKRKG